MTVVGPVPQIVNLDLDESGFGGLGDDAVLERALEKVREDCEDVEKHQVVGQGVHTSVNAARTSACATDLV
jgi:hypothetical protein